MNITKQQLKSLPQSPRDDEEKQKQAEYVHLVMEGMDRCDALRDVYPELYQKALELTGGQMHLLPANLTKECNRIERNKYVQTLFSVAEKNWWVKFLTKKQLIYERLYEIATDDNVNTKNQISAAKALLQFLPSAPREDKLEITHKVQTDDFREMLLAKKRQLHLAANGDAIDVEVEDGEV